MTRDGITKTTETPEYSLVRADVALRWMPNIGTVTAGPRENFEAYHFEQSKMSALLCGRMTISVSTIDLDLDLDLAAA